MLPALGRTGARRQECPRDTRTSGRAARSGAERGPELRCQSDERNWLGLCPRRRADTRAAEHGARQGSSRPALSYPPLRVPQSSRRRPVAGCRAPGTTCVVDIRHRGAAAKVSRASRACLSPDRAVCFVANAPAAFGPERATCVGAVCSRC